MLAKERVLVIECRSLIWPSDPHVPSKRFRLFVSLTYPIRQSRRFRLLRRPRSGRVWCITVSEEHLAKNLKTSLMRPSWEMVTTSHKTDTLDEALDFFMDWAIP